MRYQITSPRFWIIRDTATQSLEQMFTDSHSLFKLRIQHLGNKSVPTSEAESETLRIMLEALISAKKHIQQTRS